MRTRSLLASLLLLAAATPARADHQYNGVNMNGVNMNGVNMNGVNMNGVNMNGVNMSGVTLGAINADAKLEGDLLTVSLIDVASTCSHSQVQAGIALPASCSPCAQAVDAALPYCSTWYWDTGCVAKAQSVCKLQGAQLVGTIFNATMNDGNAIWLRLDGVENAPAKLPHFNGVTRTPARTVGRVATVSSDEAAAVGNADDVDAAMQSIAATGDAAGAAVSSAGNVFRFGSDVYWYTFSWRYVSWRRTRVALWYPLCDNTDRDGRYNLAIAAPGTWGDCPAGVSGPQCGGRNSADGFVLSCRDKGAIAKCIDRMGYKPWRTASACNRQGVCRDVSLERYLESCVRMVRADYCGDGVAHTQDDTEIDVFDGVGLQSRDPNISWWPEALWRPEGAACMTGYRIIDPVTGEVYSYPFNGACYHPPFGTEWSGPQCAAATATTWPGTFGGIIGDRSSKAE